MWQLWGIATWRPPDMAQVIRPIIIIIIVIIIITIIRIHVFL